MPGTSRRSFLPGGQRAVLVNCAQCTLVVRSATPKCPRCGRHNALDHQAASEPLFGSIEKHSRSENVERLFLATFLGIFGAGMLTVLILIVHQVTAGVVLPK